MHLRGQRSYGRLQAPLRMRLAYQLAPVLVGTVWYLLGMCWPDYACQQNQNQCTQHGYAPRPTAIMAAATMLARRSMHRPNKRS